MTFKKLAAEEKVNLFFGIVLVGDLSSKLNDFGVVLK